jgi:hypothetical protein
VAVIASRRRSRNETSTRTLRGPVASIQIDQYSGEPIDRCAA